MASTVAPSFFTTLGSHDLRRIPVLHTDVLVIGGGIAGAAAAISAAEAGAQVLVLTKSGFSETNTAHAQGGLAAVLAAEDSFALHLEDTLRVGAGLSDADVASRIIREGPAVIDWLRSLDARFDTDAAGALLLGREGGHSVGRVVHANGDATGQELQRAVLHHLTEHSRIDVHIGAFARDLLVQEGRCVGAIVTLDGRILAIQASSTILATGGAGQVYRETTNPIGACGDGVALAFRAGACVQDMEFVQFHPTTLYIAGASRFLVSEVLRGAGGILIDRDGIRFMTDVHPDAELAPRDIVSRAILDRMVATGDTHVYLDLGEVKGDAHALFPSISRICRSFDIDVASDPIPVRPGAHYFIGGVATGADGESSVPGLFAVGEVASTGFHGANRLASNSLLEGAVLGRAAGASAAGRPGLPLPRCSLAREQVPNPPRIHLDDMLYSLKSLMWRQVGLKRTRDGLAEALHRIGFWNHYLLRSGQDSTRAHELANMLTVSALVAHAAFERAESRGTHYRSDHPEREDSRWCRRIALQIEPDGSIRADPLDTFPPTDRPLRNPSSGPMGPTTDSENPDGD